MDLGTVALASAAAITERAAELLRDGWVQGKLYGYVKDDGGVKLDVPQKFCVLGALFLAAQEVFGVVDGDAYTTRNDAVQLAQSLIIDEAYQSTGRKLGQGSIPGWNDGMAKSAEAVCSVLDRAAKRLWDLSIADREDVGFQWEPSTWAEAATNEEDAKQFLQSALA